MNSLIFHLNEWNQHMEEYKESHTQRKVERGFNYSF